MTYRQHFKRSTRLSWISWLFLAHTAPWCPSYFCPSVCSFLNDHLRTVAAPGVQNKQQLLQVVGGEGNVGTGETHATPKLLCSVHTSVGHIHLRRSSPSAHLCMQIVNCTRNLARLVLSHAPALDQCSPGQRALLATSLRWIAASVHVLRGHLRGDTAARYGKVWHHLQH